MYAAIEYNNMNLKGLLPKPSHFKYGRNAAGYTFLEEDRRMFRWVDSDLCFNLLKKEV